MIAKYNIKWAVCTIFSLLIHLAIIIALLFTVSLFNQDKSEQSKIRVSILDKLTIRPDKLEENKQIKQAEDLKEKILYATDQATSLSKKESSLPSDIESEHIESSSIENSEYIREILKNIQDKKLYPNEAIRKNIEAKVDVSFVVGNDLMPQMIYTGSAPELLKDATLKALHDASPFPKPKSDQKLPIRINFSMDYKINN